MEITNVRMFDCFALIIIYCSSVCLAILRLTFVLTEYYLPTRDIQSSFYECAINPSLFYRIGAIIFFMW